MRIKGTPMRLFAISSWVEIGVVVAAIAGCLAATGCQRSGTPESAEASAAQSNAGIDVKPRVTPFKPVRKTLTRYCEQPGQLCALAETPLFSKVGGYVRAVHVDIGDRVVGPKYQGDQLTLAGQVLAEIDAPELTQELAQKTAAVEQANSEVAQAAA
ncbi:MAG TPA: hypothetical protein PLV92_28220, partial [Pirellulaceae bacterium]|nr:hypothetical protein [Pirellulaceae bacterium]